MQVHETELPDVLLLEPFIRRDERGYFMEMFRSSMAEKLPQINGPFVQDNLSASSRGVLRGLHYQVPPAGQGKLVSVVNGSAFDVAVDIRKSSPTFAGWVARELSDETDGSSGYHPGLLTDSSHSPTEYSCSTSSLPATRQITTETGRPPSRYRLAP